MYYGFISLICFCVCVFWWERESLRITLCWGRSILWIPWRVWDFSGHLTLSNPQNVWWCQYMSFHSQKTNSKCCLAITFDLDSVDLSLWNSSRLEGHTFFLTAWAQEHVSLPPPLSALIGMLMRSEPALRCIWFNQCRVQRGHIASA